CKGGSKSAVGTGTPVSLSLRKPSLGRAEVRPIFCPIKNVWRAAGVNRPVLTGRSLYCYSPHSVQAFRLLPGMPAARFHCGGLSRATVSIYDDSGGPPQGGRCA